VAISLIAPGNQLFSRADAIAMAKLTNVRPTEARPAHISAWLVGAVRRDLPRGLRPQERENEVAQIAGAFMPDPVPGVPQRQRAREAG